jgi:hypothetical protein
MSVARTALCFRMLLARDDRLRVAAISWFDNPAATRRSTSSSRVVRSATCCLLRQQNNDSAPFGGDRTSRTQPLALADVVVLAPWRRHEDPSAAVVELCNEGDLAGGVQAFAADGEADDRRPGQPLPRPDHPVGDRFRPGEDP